MRTTRSLALLGATAVLGTSAPAALADPAEPAAPDDPRAITASLAGDDTVHGAMHDLARSLLVDRYRAAARRADRRPSRRAAGWSDARLRHETRTLRRAARRAAAGPTGHLAAIARCESGGNPRAVSASGAYRGLFQFSVATWRAVGGTGDPADASVAEQTKRAKILYARSGPGQWPVCGR